MNSKLNSKLNARWRDFISSFSIKPLKKGHKRILQELSGLIKDSIRKNIPDDKFGILFSGGVDSTLIAKLCKAEKKDFICYTSCLKERGMEEAQDLAYAKKAAKEFRLKLKIKTANLDETERYIRDILKILKEPDVVKVGVALPFYIAFEAAKKDGIKVMFSGLGSEELFAGYERHKKSEDVNKECLNGLLNIYKRDIIRDLAIAKFHKIELRLPYLDDKLMGYALRIPPELKLGRAGNKLTDKLILREAAGQFGLKEFAWRKKQAAQYGSKFDRAIEKLAKRNGFRYKREYLESELGK